jgi:hypothetical protein
MEDPGVARRDIDRDCRMLKFNLGEATRKWPLALLAEAEDRLAAGQPREARQQPSIVPL